MIYDDVCIWIHYYVHGEDRRWILCITNSYYMLYLEPMFAEFLLFEPLNTGTVVLFWTTPVPSEFEEHLFYIIQSDLFFVLRWNIPSANFCINLATPIPTCMVPGLRSPMSVYIKWVVSKSRTYWYDFSHRWLWFLSVCCFFFKQAHSSIEQGMRGLGYYRDPKQDIGGVKGVWGLSEKRPVDTVYGIWC